MSPSEIIDDNESTHNHGIGSPHSQRPLQRFIKTPGVCWYFPEAARLKAPSVANPRVQRRRENTMVPNAAPLHSYANLYFHARNPMMCDIQQRREQLVVLRVSTEVLMLPGVVVTDGNAAGKYTKTKFFASPEGLASLVKDDVFARDWRSPDQITSWRHKSRRCAELLVPKRVESRFIVGAFVCSATAQSALAALTPDLPSVVEPDLFNT